MESKINFLFAVLAVVLIAMVAMLTYSCSSSGKPKYFPKKATYEEAMTAADSAERVLFAVFSAEWSEPSQRYLKRALCDSRVVEWVHANAQPVLLDMTNYDAGDGEAAALFNRFAIAEFPTVILVRKGQEISRLEGEKPAKELVAWLKDKGQKPVK